jgi:hypothetical protein
MDVTFDNLPKNILFIKIQKNLLSSASASIFKCLDRVKILEFVARATVFNVRAGH